MADIELPAIYIPSTFLEVVTSVTLIIAVAVAPSPLPSSVVSVESVDEAVNS